MSNDKLESFLVKVGESAPKVLPPDSLTSDAFVASARLALSLNEKLARFAETRPGDVLRGLMVAASMGLSVRPSEGHFYLVPYAGKSPKLETQVGYKGLAHCALRHPNVLDVYAFCIYRCQVKEVRSEGREIVDPRTGQPNISRDDAVFLDPEQMAESEIAGALAVAILGDSERPRTFFLLHRDIEKRADMSKSPTTGKRSPAWRNWYEQMAGKCAIKALLNSGRVPLSDAARNAMEFEDRGETTPQTVTAEVVDVQPATDGPEPVFDESNPPF